MDNKDGVARFCFLQLPPASFSFRIRYGAAVWLVADICLVGSVGKCSGSRQKLKEEITRKTDQNGRNGKRNGGVGQILFPPSSV